MKSHATLGRAAKAAFTLMEMMVVLAIIAMLIGVGVVTLKNIEDHAAITAARGQLGTLKTAVSMYRTSNRKLPRSLEELVKPPADAQVKTALVEEKGLIDPWGQKYQMRMPGKGGTAYDLHSMGPNMKDGDEDDVSP